MDRESESFVDRVHRLLGPFASDHGFAVDHSEEQADSGRAWVRFESDRIVIDAIRDRGQEWFEVMAKERPRPRAPRRAWPLGHVVGYLDGLAEPHPVSSLEREAGWLTGRAAEILEPTLLNSEGLRRWAVKASRRLFGRRAGDRGDSR